MNKHALTRWLLLALSCLALAMPGYAGEDDEIVWLSVDAQGDQQVHLYFFWSLHCPHCLNARPVVQTLAENYPWLQIHSKEVTQHPEHRQQFQQMANALGQPASSVPAFFLCNYLCVGWDHAEGMGRILVETARQCRDRTVTLAGANPLDRIQVPILGQLDMDKLSLPLFTLIIAGLDAFNPCAFFILLFLLSLLVHARSRKRMLLVGFTFVLISGIIYFLFMAAWLNLFLLLGSLPYITLIAGVLALALGGMNTREFFSADSGPSLSIPQSAKPGLFKRMGGLLSAERLPTLLLGTVTLAIAVNSYELLCTVGFPMVYTRTLTLNQLDSGSYYLYLLLYNLVYIIPLLLIVIVFTWTLGSRKLTQGEGQLLKLLSGIMMLLLGTILILAPELLNDVKTGIGLLLGAVSLVLVLAYLKKRRSALG